MASIDEPVEALDHALQCAYLAERDGAPPALIVAALLHDVGHFVSLGPGSDAIERWGCWRAASVATMSRDELRLFEQLPFATDAVRLRRWDDRAKEPDRRTPSLEHFLQLAETVRITASLDNAIDAA